MTPTATPLENIDPSRIKANPDNPRLIFREDQMNELLESIKEGGIRVPVSVFIDGTKYVLLDGERRWRCAKKLNLSTIPAIVQPKPTRLENLLMMFNIHNVRVDWDLMPMALKLSEVRDMLQKERKDTSAKALAAVTGVRLSTIQRALDLLDLPHKYQTLLLKEAQKPRSSQTIKPDLFIEIYKSLHVIERYLPAVFENVSKAQYIDAMVDKYRTGVIDSVVSLREVSKIARAERAGADKSESSPVIVKLVKERDYSIRQAFERTVRAAYEQRDLVTKLHGLTAKLSTLRDGEKLSSETKDALELLHIQIKRILA